MNLRQKDHRQGIKTIEKVIEEAFLNIIEKVREGCQNYEGSCEECKISTLCDLASRFEEVPNAWDIDLIKKTLSKITPYEHHILKAFTKIFELSYYHINKDATKEICHQVEKRRHDYSEAHGTLPSDDYDDDY